MRGLRAGGGKAHALGATDQAFDLLCPAHLQFVAGAPVRAERELALDRGHHSRMAVTEQQCAVAAEIIDVLVAIDVPLAAAGGPRGIDRVGQEGAAVVGEARRDDLARLGVKALRAARARPVLRLDLGIGRGLRHVWVPVHHPCLVGLAPSARAAQRSMLILPPASSRAVAPGGTTQVASYSSTISGPTCARCRAERATTGVSSQPSARPR